MLVAGSLALLVYSGIVIAGDWPREGLVTGHPQPEALIRSGVAASLAIAQLARGSFARASFAFATWLALFGVVAIGGQLYQRYVPDDDGNWILEPVRFWTSVASTIVLIAATVALRRRARSVGVGSTVP